MHWTLCRTACTCAWRPLRAALRSNPLIAVLVLAGTPALPLLALAAGRSASTAVDAAAGDTALARAFALAGIVACVTVGIATAALAPTRTLLGSQLAPAPVRRGALFVGLTLLPAGVVAAPAAGLVGAFAFAATAGAGPWAGAAVLASAGAGVTLGAAGAEASTAAVRGSIAGLAASGALACAWLLTGLVGGSPALGPAAVAARAVGAPRPLLALAALAAGVAGLGLWALAWVARPHARPPRGAVRIAARIPRRAQPAVAAATLARLVRNTQTRRHVATGLALAVGGSALLTTLVGGAAPFLAASVALLTAAAVPLIAAGLRRDGAWLLRVVPVAPSRLAAADAAAATVAAFAVVALVLATSAPFGRLGLGALLMLEATAALVLGAAAATGAVLPWSTDRVLEQLAAYALLAAVTGALTFALGRAVEAAPALGLTETQFAVLAAHVVLVGGIGVAAALEE